MKRKFTLFRILALDTVTFLVFLFVITTAVITLNYFAEFIKKDSSSNLADDKPPVVEPPIVKPPVVEPPVIVKPPVVKPPVVEPPVIVKPPVVEPPVIVKPPIVVQPPENTKETISVLTFGAKGDGVTDDTTAFQSGINYASKNNMILVIPNSAKNYMINNSLYLYNNTHIAGTGATLYMKPQTTIKNMFYSGDATYIKNITIEGLVLKSQDVYAGVDYYVNSLNSNIQAIYIGGVDNLIIKNVTMNNMYVGLKLGISKTGIVNKNISIDNLKIYDSKTPILIHGTNKFRMTNSILDANGGATKYLHSAYISGGNSDFYFYNVSFLNAPGGGIHLYNGYADRAAPTNMVFDNCRIDNARVGVIIYSNATNITIKNSSITKTGVAFSINSVSNLTFSNLSISKQTIHPISMGIFGLAHVSSSTFTDINIDALSVTGSVFMLSGITNDLTFNRLKISNMDNISFFNNTGETVENLVVENSIFNWKNINNQNISFRRSGQQAIFRNNTFVNNGTKFDSLVNNYSSTNISFENNIYSGFVRLCYAADYSKTYNNLNLDTNKYDTNK